MAEKLCPEYQKLMIPSSGIKKNAGRESGFALHGEKLQDQIWEAYKCQKHEKADLTGAEERTQMHSLPPSRPFSTWAANYYIHSKSLIQADVLGCWDDILLFSCVQLPFISVFNQIIWIKRAVSSERCYVCLQAFIWALKQESTLCAWLGIFCLHRNHILKMLY